MKLFENLGVYGWNNISDLLLSGVVGNYPVLLVGESGVAKTFASERLGAALDKAYRARGEGSFIYKYRNASTAAVEDIVGFPLPPHQDDMKAAKKTGKDPIMQFVRSPDNIVGAEMLILDEINRCLPLTQNRWFSVINEGRVDGVDLNLEVIIGAMNPPHAYEGTEVLDRAFAGRFNLLIRPNNFDDMEEKDKRKIAASRLHENHEIASYEDGISLEDATEIVEYIEEARKALSLNRKQAKDAVCEYALEVTRSLNESIGGNARTQAKINSRRVAMVVESIMSVWACAQARGDGHLPSDALQVLRGSFMHEVCGDEPFSSAQIESAHEKSKSMLESPKARLISKIEKEDNRARRVVKAIEIDAGGDIISEFIQTGHNYYVSRDPARASAFSYALMSRLQSLNSEKINSEINLTVLDDDMVADINNVHRGLQEVEEIGLTLNAFEDGFSESASLLSLLSDYQKTPSGRVSVAIAAAHMGDTTDDFDTAFSSAADDAESAATFYSLATSVKQSIIEFQEIFAEIQ